MKTTGLILSAFLFSIQLLAQSEMQTKSISVFKNGKSFVIKEGSVKTTDNTYILDKMPNALFGTLWFLAGQSGIKQVVSKMEKTNEPIERKAISFRDLLYANKGKQLSIVTTDNKTYTGTIDDFDLSEEVSDLMTLKQEELAEIYDTRSSHLSLPLPKDPQIVLIKIDKKWISLNPLDIKTIEFLEKPENTLKLNVKTKKPVIKVTFEKGGNQQLRMMYLQNGISWTPTYLLEISSDNAATLKLQAEVSNSAEDIVDMDMNFVVGVPNFRFADNPAILTSIINKITQDSRGYLNTFNNSIVSQLQGFYSGTDNDETNSNPEVTEAEASEDYYFYNVKHVSLEAYARAIYPLYSKPIKIKHLYECNLNKTGNSSNENRGSSNYSFDSKMCEVFHSIEIENSTSDPLTTGSVMIIDKSNKPLAQDLIKYTAAGQSSFIKLTQAPDIKVEETETVVSNKEDVKKLDGYTYDLTTIQNEIVIVNSKKQSIDMAISKAVGGTLKDVSIKYTNKKTVDKRNLNPTNNLEIRPTLKAGETIKITYTYEAYIQN